jgi:hypothetical protein
MTGRARDFLEARGTGRKVNLLAQIGERLERLERFVLTHVARMNVGDRSVLGEAVRGLRRRCEGWSSTPPPTLAQVRGGWPPHPHLWIMACDHDTARRVPLGCEDAPTASLGRRPGGVMRDPGFLPTRQDRGAALCRRQYRVDIEPGRPRRSRTRPGDLPEPDVVAARLRGRSLAERTAAVLRQAAGRKLDSEAEQVRRSGTDVLLIQPTVHDLDAMGSNLMSAGRRHDVIDVGARNVAAYLRKAPVRSRLAGLPPGGPLLVRRPPRTTAPLDFARLAAMRSGAPADPGRQTARSLGRDPTDPKDHRARRAA